MAALTCRSARIAFIALFSVLSACASLVGNELTVFHEWPSAAPRTFRLVRTSAQADSLAHANFERIVRAELLRGGFVESDAPRFEVGFDYQGGERIRRAPDYGPYFVPYFVFGTGGPHGYLQFSAPLSWWAGERTERRYERRLMLTIRDLRSIPARRVYEGTAINEGYSPESLNALPYLVRALLVDFPGPSGQTRWVDVPASPETAK